MEELPDITITVPNRVARSLLTAAKVASKKQKHKTEKNSYVPEEGKRLSSVTQSENLDLAVAVLGTAIQHADNVRARGIQEDWEVPESISRRNFG